MWSPTSSSSTASDEEFRGRAHKRKRKWKHFFRRLTREVIRRQEEMQNRFLEAVGKCEEERAAREEAARLQDMARIHREHEILLQESSAATAKDAAVLSLLQKVSTGIPTGVLNFNHTPAPATAPATAPAPAPPVVSVAAPERAENANSAPQLSHQISSVITSPFSNSSSSRWPKAEIEELIKLRTNLDLKYEEKAAKGPLWEEISAGMRRLGYERSAKRCKEKWENINKYFKKLKDSNRKRSEDSKTCPYFNQLAAIYGSEKAVAPPPLQPFGMEPLMVQPERQWPVPEPGRDDVVLADDEEEEEEDYEGDEEEDRRDQTSSTTEVEEDHDHHNHHELADIRSSMNMVE